MNVIVFAVLIALAAPTLAFGGNLENDVKWLQSEVKRLRSEVTEMQVLEMEFMDANDQWRKATLKTLKKHKEGIENTAKLAEVLARSSKFNLKELKKVPKFVATVQKNTLEMCADMIVHHGRITNLPQPRDLKSRLLAPVR